MMLTGVIFDLDGTLVDSRLDFSRIRRELGMPPGTPILEAIEDLPADEQKVYHSKLLQHELDGARSATLMPGVKALLQRLEDLQLQVAVFTRNSKPVAEYTLQRLGLDIDLVVAREDAPPKPDPSGLLLICEQWGCSPSETLYIGDYHFDLEAGRRAGVPTILYSPQPVDFDHDAAQVITHFDELWPLLQTTVAG